ncbi:Rrf2 family transcriptional regulator [Polaromonas sp. SM01]|uniref:Rrf2 family transcriptional regulator n=1 Tax=Polaromonas sp. SM01 TaxID=3085630 RepID=UPI002980C949|nr:Rrf2 family transcriptional regulator [Polaromonas sp. SM01]MDW5444018.1 Rrf2 family transcriptional regulator [Polaromonas sp. SM01]
MFEVQDSHPINGLGKNEAAQLIIRFFRIDLITNTNLREVTRCLCWSSSRHSRRTKRRTVIRLSTKSRFAVTALIDIALRGNAGPISLADIGSRHEISLSYLEQLFSKLRQCGLVKSTRGPGGGYRLGRAAEAISVADIVGAVESDANQLGRGEKVFPQKENSGALMTQELWAALNAKMVEHMQSISLLSLADELRAKGVPMDARPGQRGVYTAPAHKPLASLAPNSIFALGRSLLIPR